MKTLVILTCFLLILASCSEVEPKKNKITLFNVSDQYQLIEVDAYSFRRAYHGQDTLVGNEWALFMDRNPEPIEDYTHSNHHPFFQQLSKLGLLKDGNLNIKELEPLPAQFNYQISQKHSTKVKTRLLEDPKQVKFPSYELSFMDSNHVLLIDTLAFDWPPDITFIKKDIDEDGTEELISIFRWYIQNGDNFDLKIYKLNTFKSVDFNLNDKF